MSALCHDMPAGENSFIAFLHNEGVFFFLYDLTMFVLLWSSMTTLLVIYASYKPTVSCNYNCELELGTPTDFSPYHQHAVMLINYLYYIIYDIRSTHSLVEAEHSTKQTTKKVFIAN